MGEVEKIPYCLYARKSTEQDEKQALSIDSQVKEMEQIADREGIWIKGTIRESHSAKDSGQRPAFNQLIEEVRSGQYQGVLTWAPDRLSRNAGDLGSLVDLMDQGKLVNIQTYSQTFSNNPNEKFLLMILCSQAKLENDNKSINVKRGIRTKCEMGWRPGVAPLGYMNRAFNGIHDIITDLDRAPYIRKIFEKAGYDGWSGRRLKIWLDKEGFTNRSGNKVTLSQIFLILNNTFYYGEFEFPEGGGKIYKGSHEPLVTKELYDLVRYSRNLPSKAEWGSKKFAFKGIFRCGSCGSEITAEEKFKPLKNGTFNRHVYYHCTRQVKYDCPERYLNEDLMIEQLVEFIKKNEEVIKISSGLKLKSDRHLTIVRGVLGQHQINSQDLRPLCEYAEFILKQGDYSEKADFVKGVQGTFKITSRQITL